MFASTFLPWGEISASTAANNSGVGDEIAGVALSLLGDSLTLPISGWVGSWTPLKLDLPNWLPLLAIVSAAVMAWLRAAHVTRIPYKVVACVLLYAGIHLVSIFLNIRGGDGSKLGIGWFLSFLTVTLCFFALVPRLSASQPEPPLHETQGVE